MLETIDSLLLTACIVLFWLGTLKLRMMRIKKENLSKNDFKFDPDYYRDILKEYSPIELSYLDNMQLIDLRNAIIATILNLKLKNKVEITEKGIKVLDKEDETLSDNEKHILEHISVGKLELVKDDILAEFARNELIEKGLIKRPTKKQKIKNERRDFIMLLLDKICAIILFFFLICFDIDTYVNNDVFIEIYESISRAGVYLCFFSIFFSPGMISSCILRSIYTYERTPKGEEINLKLEGLKKYLEDYGKFEYKEKEMLVVWEEYLIYSVIFGLNYDKIFEDISNFVVLTDKPKNYTRYHY